MATARQLSSMLDGTGFESFEIPGFHGFRRRYGDRDQVLLFFSWSNPKIADRRGIPRSYLVLLPFLDHGEDECGRYIIPQVEWPSKDQKRRPWQDVADEFRQVFLPIMDAPADQARDMLDHHIDLDRYAIRTE